MANDNTESIKDLLEMLPKRTRTEPVVPRGTDSAELVTIIKTVALRGSGKENDPCRPVMQYWDLDGTFLAENDPCENRRR